MKRFFSCLLATLLLLLCCACGGSPDSTADTPDEDSFLLDGTDPGEAGDDGYVPDDEGPADNAGLDDAALPENGSYTTKDDVALYLNTYGHLPDNFITKQEAQDLGWPGGSLEPYAPGKCIGGSYFGNYEGLLPEAQGRSYNECDINTLGADSRGAERLVYSNDGLIYYTGDHYESFELLYGEE